MITMTNTNIDIKIEALRKNVKLYELPDKLGICSAKFYRLIRVPLSEQDRERILKAIKEIADSR